MHLENSSKVDVLVKVAALFIALLCVYLVTTNGWDAKYLFLIAALLVCVSTLYLPFKQRANVTILIFALGAPVYAVNLVLAIASEVDRTYPRSHWRLARQGAAHAKALALVARQMGTDFDTRSRLDVLLDLRKRGVDAWPSIASAVLFRDYPKSREIPLVGSHGKPVLPLGGISSKTAVYCNENGSYILLDNDEHGFPNPRGIWSLSQIDLAVVGDSFAHGACVPQDQSFTALLRKRYPASINVGNDANGPLAELATLREYLPGLKPKIVLWVYCEVNDLPDLVKEHRSPLVKYLEPGYRQGLVDKQEEIDQELMNFTEEILDSGTTSGRVIGLLAGFLEWENYRREFEQIVKCSYVWRLVTRQDETTVEGGDLVLDSESAAEALRMFRDVLRLANDSVQRWGGELVFVYLPQWERYGGEGEPSPYREKVLDLVADLHIPTIDLHPIFSRQRDPLRLFPFRRPAHYNAEGYQLVAQEIDRHISLGLRSVQEELETDIRR